MKSYETTDSGGRIVCKEHERLRCEECAYVSEMEEEIAYLREGLTCISAEHNFDSPTQSAEVAKYYLEGRTD